MKLPALTGESFLSCLPENRRWTGGAVQLLWREPFRPSNQSFLWPFSTRFFSPGFPSPAWAHTINLHRHEANGAWEHLSRKGAALRHCTASGSLAASAAACGKGRAKVARDQQQTVIQPSQNNSGPACASMKCMDRQPQAR